MIICKYDELKKYRSLLKYLDRAQNCVEHLCKEGLSTGRYEYEGGFLLVQQGETKSCEKNRYEVHRKYIDVQYMVEGEEETLYAPLSDLDPCIPYDEENDIEFLSEGEAVPIYLQIKSGMCYVVFPEDGHMPCRCTGETKKYLKIVMKLPVS